MNAAPTKGTAVRFRRDVFDRLVEPHGYRTDRQKADLIGCARTTLWRASNGLFAPSAEFIAKVRAALPRVPIDELFDFGPASDQAA